MSSHKIDKMYSTSTNKNFANNNYNQDEINANRQYSSNEVKLRGRDCTLRPANSDIFNTNKQKHTCNQESTNEIEPWDSASNFSPQTDRSAITKEVQTSCSQSSKFEDSKNKLFGTTNNNDYKVNKDYSKNQQPKYNQISAKDMQNLQTYGSTTIKADIVENQNNNNLTAFERKHCNMKTTLYEYDKKPLNFYNDKLISPIESTNNAAREEIKHALGDIDKTPQEMNIEQMKSNILIDQSQKYKAQSNSKYDLVQHNNPDNNFKRNNQMASDIFCVNDNLKDQYDNLYDLKNEGLKNDIELANYQIEKQCTNYDKETIKQHCPSEITSKNIIYDNMTDASMSKANTQANLTSILQRPEFYSDSIKLKEEETYVIEMNLYKIDQKQKEYDIKKRLMNSNIQIVKIELRQNPITGSHEENAKLIIRIKESQVKMAYNILQQMNIKVVNVEDESLGRQNNQLSTCNIKWSDKHGEKKLEEFQSIQHSSRQNMSSDGCIGGNLNKQNKENTILNEQEHPKQYNQRINNWDAMPKKQVSSNVGSTNHVCENKAYMKSTRSSTHKNLRDSNIQRKK